MKKTSDLNSDFKYVLLDENQQDIDLREKLSFLYASPFADILWWELRDLSLKDNGYYKLFYYEQNELKQIILFKYSDKSQKKIFVINKVFKITKEEIENICHILFYEFDKSQQIIFDRLYEPTEKKSSKILFEKTSNDVIILNIPNTMDTYMKTLGTSIQKNVQYMKRRISKDFPKFEVHYLENNEIKLEQIEKIVSLNKDRMKTKGQESLLNKLESNALHQYAVTSGFGFLCVCIINDQIIGGTINSVIGEHAYLHVISHDIAYNKYSIGQIALIHATQYLIEKKNIKYYHLLFGTSDYKFRHGGVNHELYAIRSFRKNDVYYFCGKTMSVIRGNYRILKRKLKYNKTFYSWYFKLNKMKTKLLDFIEK